MTSSQPGAPSGADVILIVDDDLASLRMLADALEWAGFTVLVARSGSAAIDLLEHAFPDLILMDAVMPGLDGFETTAQIKATAAYASIPVIFMTGLAGSEHVVKGFGVGGADYVRKPLVIEELLARVRAHINKEHAMQATLAGLEASGRLMIAADRHGRLRWCAPAAEPVLAGLEPGWSAASGMLPQAMRLTMERLFTIRKVCGASAKMEVPGGLQLTLISVYRDDTLLIRLNVADVDIDVETLRLQDSLGLTRREAEVLLWVSYGKPSRVIGDILNISPRTVHKHLERIFDKLGIETRSAATAIAIRQATP